MLNTTVLMCVNDLGFSFIFRVFAKLITTLLITGLYRVISRLCLHHYLIFGVDPEQSIGCIVPVKWTIK